MNGSDSPAEGSAARLQGDGSAPVVVAIDGPAASGKSTVARLVAARLGFAHLNTGAMYRAATWLALERGLNPADGPALAAALDAVPVQLCVRDGEAIFEMDGRPVSTVAEASGVAEHVSTVARCPEVRRRLVAWQRKFAAMSDLVVEGRDIGSVVFPDTPYKFYIDADPEVRARRRQAQGLRDEISSRDALDMSRTVSPLQVADNAERIDTSRMTLEEVIACVLRCLATRGLHAAQEAVNNVL